jgi:hypothetical protein
MTASVTGLWRQRAGVKETPVDADLFLVLPDNGEIYHLNAIGAALWRLLAEQSSPQTAGDTLALAFPDLPRGAIDTDVQRFITELRQRALIEAA